MKLISLLIIISIFAVSRADACFIFPDYDEHYVPASAEGTNLVIAAATESRLLYSGSHLIRLEVLDDFGGGDTETILVERDPIEISCGGSISIGSVLPFEISRNTETDKVQADYIDVVRAALTAHYLSTGIKTRIPSYWACKDPDAIPKMFLRDRDRWLEERGEVSVALELGSLACEYTDLETKTPIVAEYRSLHAEAQKEFEKKYNLQHDSSLDASTPSYAPRIIGKPIHIWLSSDGTLKAKIFIEESFDYPVEDIVEAELQLHRFEAFGQSHISHAQLGESGIFAITPNGKIVYLRTASAFEFDRLLAKQLGMTGLSSDCAEELEADGVSLNKICDAWNDLYYDRLSEFWDFQDDQERLDAALIEMSPSG